MSLAPDAAIRFTNVARLGALAGGALAVAALLLAPGAPGVNVPDVPTPQPRVAAGSGEDERPRQADLAWMALGEQLAAFAPEPPPPIDSETEDDSETPDDQVIAERSGDPEITEPAPPEWRYLGPIITPQARRALIAIGGVQRIVAEGQSIEDYTVRAVEEARVVIQSPSGGRFQVQRVDAPVNALAGAAVTRPESTATDERQQEQMRLLDRARSRDPRVRALQPPPPPPPTEEDDPDA